MSNFDPFADIAIPEFQTEGLTDAVAAIREALQSTPRARDTTAAGKLAKLVEDLRVLNL